MSTEPPPSLVEPDNQRPTWKSVIAEVQTADDIETVMNWVRRDLVLPLSVRSALLRLGYRLEPFRSFSPPEPLEETNP